MSEQLYQIVLAMTNYAAATYLKQRGIVLESDGRSFGNILANRTARRMTFAEAQKLRDKMIAEGLKDIRVEYAA